MNLQFSCEVFKRGAHPHTGVVRPSVHNANTPLGGYRKKRKSFASEDENANLRGIIGDWYRRYLVRPARFLRVYVESQAQALYACAFSAGGVPTGSA